ncbi:hypothetical protein [Sphingobacterium thalpophilum]|uniref:Uncharacterized protein n=1 Tax=Sphingobacterium thalpophilum TaxID=259 RepID=A0A4U9VYT6_9SPHI|nr:hypothetical protein [Sphingobacterium thalpophilum]VTR49031.1 Uncharacterised protein [Sphingobacterium thalpophilum]
MTEKENHAILGGNSSGAGPAPEIKIDSNGRTYYVDNIGRVNYLADTNMLFEAIVDSGKSFATWVGAGYDLIKGSLGLPATAGSIGYNALEKVYNNWYTNYFAEGGYIRSNPGYNPWWNYSSSGNNNEGSGSTYPGEGLPPK